MVILVLEVADQLLELFAAPVGSDAVSRLKTTVQIVVELTSSNGEATTRIEIQPW
ncbi:hypothetical protein C497_02442 [Halalkalicoccus jeotgali B3]|uniref:Uncharacterized protein n=1 Tax=Halalkalicoccus jeotgali (strain DSM 18796 / CECT 7217 / JCM 14584 / KCTC 4019 / B3) TaxID=795797 RepID=D8JBW8_HALJB|nr:hypothetical protein HacjB3_17116 [Halalkalicoccus jeotgali B3]ELY40903.1 hypothetical protein C497_02442 [Halalkalicoccus jeotgali B3]